MKKLNFLHILAGVLVALVMTGCSDNEEKIVGVWSRDTRSNRGQFTEVYNFEKDGTMEYGLIPLQPGYWGYTVSGTYEVDFLGHLSLNYKASSLEVVDLTSWRMSEPNYAMERKQYESTTRAHIYVQNAGFQKDGYWDLEFKGNNKMVIIQADGRETYTKDTDLEALKALMSDDEDNSYEAVEGDPPIEEDDEDY